jgi:carbonic anhydrase/acetyltransferase-like protein (isoleucine patch superfamily)
MIRALGKDRPRLGAGAWVDETALVIGDVALGANVSVWPMSVLRGDVQSISVGERSNIQDGSVLHVSHDSSYLPGGLALNVGCDVTVGHRAILHACTVADRVLVGMGAIVMDGAEVGPDCIIAAGALVPPGKVLEGGYLWVGSPVRRARPLSDEEREYLRYSAAHYLRLKARHEAG